MKKQQTVVFCTDGNRYGYVRHQRSGYGITG